MIFDEAMEALREGKCVRRAKFPETFFANVFAGSDIPSYRIYEPVTSWLGKKEMRPSGYEVNPALYGVLATDWEIVEDVT